MIPQTIETQVVLLDKFYSSLLSVHFITIIGGVCVTLAVAATRAMGGACG